jgi:hypothetical protein
MALSYNVDDLPPTQQSPACKIIHSGMPSPVLTCMGPDFESITSADLHHIPLLQLALSTMARINVDGTARVENTPAPSTSLPADNRGNATPVGCAEQPPP